MTPASADLSLTGSAPVAYVDADVRFFPGAADLSTLADADGPPAWFLQDCGPWLDQRLLRPGEHDLTPLNAGFFVLRQPLSFEAALARLAALDGEPSHFTEQ